MPKKRQDIEVHMSQPLTLAQFAAKANMSIDDAAKLLVQLAERGLAKVTDADRGLYRLCYLTRGKSNGRAP
ncbi:hypothetical protein [Bradyrhizobium sp. SZCCHNS3004]|uniref:hypothetical protein n=1 Tax=Bradyrhizobium sp. SZCCHNS3004 TaxID=3057312 RepID=UPI002916EA9A|nr:hypothetical protein [Bradyrhizobium sp. SZCCHNS3004]